MNKLINFCMIFFTKRSVLSYLIMIITISIFSGCSSHFTEAITPEDAVDQQFAKQPITLDPHGATHVSTHYFGDMAILLYRSPLPSTIFFGVAWRDGNIWYTNECCDTGGGTMGSHPSLIDFSADIIPSHGLAVFGERLDPQAQLIEGTFQGGSIVRTSFQGDYFVLFAPDELNLCELRVYDQEHTLLQRTDPIGQPLDAPLPGCK